MNGVDAGGICNSLSWCLSVTGDKHRALNTLILDLFDRVSSGRTNRILQFNHTDVLPFTGDVNNRAVDIRQALDTAGDHQLAVAYQQNVITDTGAHATAREFLKFLDLWQFFLACTCDCARNRML